MFDFPKYPKIESIFIRQKEKPFKLLEGQYRLPEFCYLRNNAWLLTEKIDGTNVRVNWDPETGKVTLGGRTDSAQMPTFLIQRLMALFPAEKFRAEYPDMPMTLFGEGYGAKIQKGGGKYKSDGVDFALFDVYIDGWWLKHEDVTDIAEKLDCQLVPKIGISDLAAAVAMAKNGFASELPGSDRMAEGLVCRPVVPLLMRNGSRVITKVKFEDFAR